MIALAIHFLVSDSQKYSLCVQKDRVPSALQQRYDNIKN